MKDVDPELAAMLDARTAGMTHTERENYALRVASKVAREPVAFLECSKAGLTGWMDRDPARAEANEVRELTQKFLARQLDERGQTRLLNLMDRAEGARMKAARNA